MLNNYTHNGPPAFESAADLPDGMPRIHFFKCDIEALWGVLVEMSLEQGGLYMRALLAMYRHMEGLPADDQMACMRLGGIDIRVYRRLKKLLLSTPKCLVEKSSGRISNARFEEEITAYVTEWRNRHEAAIEREKTLKTKRQNVKVADEKRETSGKDPANFSERSSELSRDLSNISGKDPRELTGQVHEKCNQINGGGTTTVPQRAPQADHESDLRARVLELELELRGRTRGQSSDSTSRESGVEPVSETGVSDGGGDARSQGGANGHAVASNDPPAPQAPEFELIGPDVPAEPRRTAYSADFEAFWRDYPETRGMSKFKAWQRWVKLGAQDRRAAMAALPAFVADLKRRRERNPSSTPLHAEGYLNQRRFETLLQPEPEPSKANEPWWTKPENLNRISIDQWRGSISRHADQIWRVDKLGPPPGTPNCVVPRALVAELRLAEKYTTAGILRR